MIITGKDKNYCCELCGLLIKGKCNYDKDTHKITHIDSCVIYDDETKLRINGGE